MKIIDFWNDSCQMQMFDWIKIVREYNNQIPHEHFKNGKFVCIGYFECYKQTICCIFVS